MGALCKLSRLLGLPNFIIKISFFFEDVDMTEGMLTAFGTSNQPHLTPGNLVLQQWFPQLL